MRNRSVIELLVLALTAVAGFSILAMGATIALVEIRDPEVDTGPAAQALLSIVSATLGALFGLLAGRSRTTDNLSVRPGDDEPTDVEDRPT